MQSSMIERRTTEQQISASSSQASRTCILNRSMSSRREVQLDQARMIATAFVTSQIRKGNTSGGRYGDRGLATLCFFLGKSPQELVRCTGGANVEKPVQEQRELRHAAGDAPLNCPVGTMDAQPVIQKCVPEIIYGARRHEAVGEGRVGMGGGEPVLHLPIHGQLFLKRELIDGRPIVRQSYLQLKFISDANQSMQPVGCRLLE